MKKYLKVVLGAVLVGSFLAFIFYKDIKKEVNAIASSNNTIYLFQVGVFKNIENANNLKINFASKIVYPDDEYYRVFTAVTSSNSNKEKLMKYFDRKKINYFVKEMEKEGLKEELENYEIMLEETDKEEVIDKINQDMLNIFMSYNQNLVS